MLSSTRRCLVKAFAAAPLAWPFAAHALAQATPSRVKVIAVGGAGCNILNTVIASGVTSGDDAVCVNTDSTNLTKSLAATRIVLPARVLLASATQTNFSVADHPHLNTALSGIDVVILVAGLGGAAGTHLTPAIAHVASCRGTKVVTVAILPFCNEVSRYPIASIGLLRISAHSHHVLSIANDSLFAGLPPDMSVADAFNTANGAVASRIRSVLRVFASG